MTKIYLIIFILMCSVVYGNEAPHPDSTDAECVQLYKKVYMSGVPDIKIWNFKNFNDTVTCTGTLKYNTPLELKLGCHARTQSFEAHNLRAYSSRGFESVVSKNSDVFLDVVINPKDNDARILCTTYFRESSLPSMTIVVKLVYEPIKTLPMSFRPNLENAIVYKLNTSGNGDVCGTHTDITVKAGPLMIKIFGNYDGIDYFWCQNIAEEGIKAKVFLSTDDFSEFENPKEAITIIDTKHVGENHTKWNCNYENANSKITCTGLVHIIGSKARQNELIFKFKDPVCQIEESSRHFSIKEGNTLMVKVLDPYDDVIFKFWCDRFDKNAQNNSKVLETLLSFKHYDKERVASAAIPIKSLHGEFDCFVAKDGYITRLYRGKSMHNEFPDTDEKLCHVRLNVIDASKLTSTDNPEHYNDLTMVWISVVVGIVLVVLCLAAGVFLFKRQRGLETEQNQEEPTDSEQIYTYARAEMVPMQQARALAAANRRIPKYKSFMPSLPPRDDHEYTYISEVRPKPGASPPKDEAHGVEDSGDEHNQPSSEFNDHYYSNT